MSSSKRPDSNRGRIVIHRQISTLLFVLAFVPIALGEVRSGPDVDPEHVVALMADVDAGLGAVVPSIFQEAKGTYLEDYGLVITVEIALEPRRSPFSTRRSPEEIRSSSHERLEAVRTAAAALLGDRVADLNGLLPNERVSLVIHILNPSPVDLPDLPAQIVLTLRKQDAMDRRSGALSDADFRQRLTIRER